MSHFNANSKTCKARIQKYLEMTREESFLLFREDDNLRLDYYALMYPVSKVYIINYFHYKYTKGGKGAKWFSMLIKRYIRRYKIYLDYKGIEELTQRYAHKKGYEFSYLTQYGIERSGLSVGYPKRIGTCPLCFKDIVEDVFVNIDKNGNVILIKGKEFSNACSRGKCEEICGWYSHYRKNHNAPRFWSSMSKERRSLYIITKFYEMLAKQHKIKRKGI